MLNVVGIVFLILMVINCALEIALDFLNLRHLKNKANELPSVFQSRIDHETFKKSLSYNSDSVKFDMVETVISFLFVICLVYVGGFAFIDHMARSVRPNGYYLPAVLFGMSIFFIKFFVDLPLNLYGTFVIEERYGFNKTTPNLFISDLIKSVALSILIGTPLFLGMLWFMEKTGDYWWIWCWCFLETVQLLLFIVYPAWIAPWFNKFTPIEEGELKDRIVSLCNKIGFPSQGIFIMNGSKRSKHSNAFFTGLGKKKQIVLLDTLIQQMEVSHILAVLAHEFGHYKLHHLKKMFVLQSFFSLAALYILSLLFRWEIFYHGFGFSQPSNYAALIIFSLCISSLSFLFMPFFSLFSRKLEYGADEFAVKHLENPGITIEVIGILAKENLMNVNPHPWYSFFRYSHPAPVERVQAIEKLLMRLQGTP